MRILCVTEVANWFKGFENTGKRADHLPLTLRDFSPILERARLRCPILKSSSGFPSLHASWQLSSIWTMRGRLGFDRPAGVWNWQDEGLRHKKVVVKTIARAGNPKSIEFRRDFKELESNPNLVRTPDQALLPQPRANSN
jgi:hypothetical protein